MPLWVVLVTLAVLAATEYAAARSSAGWVLTLDEEFEGTTLNETLWNIRNNESHCCQLGLQELQLYVGFRSPPPTQPTATRHLLIRCGWPLPTTQHFLVAAPRNRYMKEEVIVSGGQLAIRTRPGRLYGPTSRHGLQWYNFSSGWIDTQSREWCPDRGTCSLVPFPNFLPGCSHTKVT